jgi:archaellum component FlaF (FlaF/FlaG flagellin family)
MFFFIFLSSFVFAIPDQIIINSRNWEDVYSVMVYAQLLEVDANYPIEETRATLLIQTIDKDKNNVLLFESKEMPYVRNFNVQLNSAGFNTEVFSYDSNMNLDILKNSEIDIKNFIIIDSVYSYNAVSVAPYASLTNSYVIFANSDNIDEIVNYFSNNKPNKLLIYGYVDREVSNKLSEFNPEIINKGSKYENNIELAKKFYSINKPTQLILTNGLFIEPQFFMPQSPIILIGRNNIPDVVFNYLKQNDVKNAVLIGNDLTDLAVTLKNNADMKIFIKFAKGINQVQYTLDILEFPKLNYGLSITNVMYNSVSSQLFITFENTGNTPLMFKGSFSIDKDGEIIANVGDDQIIYISPGNAVTRTYDINLEEYANDLIYIKANILYGEDSRSLDLLFLDEKLIEFIRFTDNSNIKIVDFYYDKNINRFVIEVENIGKETVFINLYLENFIFNDRPQNLYSEQITRIEPNKKEKIMIRARLTKEDILENSNTKIVSWYGSQRNLLFKLIEVEFELKVKSDVIYYIVGFVVMVLIAILILIIFIKKKKKKRHYHHHNNHSHHHHMPPSPRMNH